MARASLYPRDTTYRSVGDQIAGVLLQMPQIRRWWLAFGVTGLLVLLLGSVIVHLFTLGVGVWGINIPVNWGLAIVNVVWWIGIGHAGTFISAMLLLLGQEWRNSLNRLAEAMTIFAVTCAVMFPILHLGRPNHFYWMLPYPPPFEVWPQFRSPLFWDMMAFSTYFTVSLLFWYVGLIPDLASVRDKARRRFWQVLMGLLALGWRGSARHWVTWRRAYLIIAALAMPLVVSVHSGVSLLFAVGKIPGWHTTIFPPYFVLGALFSGFAVVGMLGVALRAWFRLRNLITREHLDRLAKFLLASGLLTAYGYVFDGFTAWYSGRAFEQGTLVDRLTGPFAGWYWGAVLLNFASIQLLWWRSARRNPATLFAVSTAVLAGMWLERYMLVVSGLFRDFLPSSWDVYRVPWTEWLLFLGTIGLFLFLFVLFLRFLPLIAISEVKEVIEEEQPPPAGPEPETEMGTAAEASPVIGTIARFDAAERLVEAARRASAAGFRRIDAYTPFPVVDLNRALGLRERALPWIVAIAGAGAAIFGFWLLWFVDVVHFPIVIGGMPLDAWTAYGVPVFEFVVLVASITAVIGMLVINRLPRLNHPLFAVPGFERASQDRFFLLIRSTDPRFEREPVRAFLAGLHPESVREVPL
ncbi:MAG TPA: quinol:electron acceptor oxidoreductase subunit ActD [Woeseiaceae bacterium]|nr:quinol:electron acceptor oxidoreductase subunit ActD [Woeseiaceae bacterium]